MTFNLTSLDQLSEADVQQAHDEISQLLQEKYPELDLRRGVLHDIVAFLAGGVCGAISQHMIREALTASSLSELLTSSADVPADRVDRLLANYNLQRRQGTAARGYVTVVVTKPDPVVVLKDTTFTVASLQFTATSAVTATTTPNSTQSLLLSRGNNRWEFNVPVTAVAAGVIGNVAVDTPFTISPQPANVVSAYANGDFFGGRDEETNEELLERQQLGLAKPGTSSPSHIIAKLQQNTDISDAGLYSIIGFGDPEMTRDSHGLLPISRGGKVDVYCRTSPTPQTQLILKQCTVIQHTNGIPLWQCELSREETAGVYFVQAIRNVSPDRILHGRNSITLQRTPQLLPQDTARHDIETAVEAYGSAFQSLVVQFTSPDFGDQLPAVGSTRDFYLSLWQLPYIASLQQWIDAPENRHPSGDILIKAGVPCRVIISCTGTSRQDYSEATLTVISETIAARINQLPFTSTLYASLVSDVLQAELPHARIDYIDMHGSIAGPLQDIVIRQDGQALRIPSLPASGITAKTTMFVAAAADINLSLVRA